ncbi:transposase, partial [Microbacterium lacticum]|uniref:transposase n=1 Tax=Microbacterium lacticum TaxID=33885 RepID=UPI003D36DF6A
MNFLRFVDIDSRRPFLITTVYEKCHTPEHPDALIFASFPGIGPVLTAVLLAEIGEDRARFPQPE